MQAIPSVSIPETPLMVVKCCPCCSDRYSACASPTCAGVNGNQLDGCDTSMPEVAQTFCATLNPLQVGSACGSYSCSPGPFMPGSLPGDAGCTFMDDDGSGCDAGADCQTPACTNGACSLIPNDAACACVPDQRSTLTCLDMPPADRTRFPEVVRIGELGVQPQGVCHSSAAQHVLLILIDMHLDHGSPGGTCWYGR